MSLNKLWMDPGKSGLWTNPGFIHRKPAIERNYRPPVLHR